MAQQQPSAAEMPPPFKVPSNLPELVRTAFHRAKSNGDLVYYPTQVTLLDVNSVPFQLRFSPALANKPNKKSNSPPPPGGKPKAFFDPFENPRQELLVFSSSRSSHRLVLNKFAIVPEHFILATSAFKEQTHLLEAEDLAATYACIDAYYKFADERKEYGELFAFFNSGEHSGASQPHRHVQLLPVGRMREGLSGETTEWGVLADRLLVDEDVVGRKLPFKTFTEKIWDGMSGEELRKVYLDLYKRATRAVKAGFLGREGAEEVKVEERAEISYNLAMTRDVMVVMPRLAEGAEIIAPGSGGGDDGGEKVVGKLALNGTVLAGTALVKSQEEWDVLRANPETVVDLLGKVGVPTDEGEDDRRRWSKV